MIVWLPIKDFPSYEINQYGDVRNIHTKYIKMKRTNAWGYNDVKLKGKDKKFHTKLVHRLVAKTFYDISEERSNILQVNHIDGNKTNNFIANLEWVTGKQNVQHAYDTGIRKPSGGRGKIRRIKNLETGEIFDNMAECAKSVNGDSGNISRCVRGLIKSYKGYHFVEADNE